MTWKTRLLPLLLLAPCPGAWATDDAPGAAREHGYLSLQVENDFFGGAGTDRHFTNGFRLSWTPKDQTVLEPVLDILAQILPGQQNSANRRASFALGQNMYTPTDITVPELIPDERPYAGWSYVSAGFVAQSGNRLDKIVLSVGIVGPASGAGATQHAWHDWFGFDEPRGWANQLRNEPTLNLFAERQWRVPLWQSDGGLEMDVIPGVSAALGNVFTYAGVSGIVRIGHNLCCDFGPPRIKPSLPGSTEFQTRNSANVSWYGFIGVDGRAVARNLFLDGNTFRDSHSVPSKALVGDLQMGFVVAFDAPNLPPMRLSYTYIFRSKEYDGQERADQFGAISLTIAY